ncbi:MAG: TraM recognition domain-containing protein [Gammaproteobacteria bacterium]|nr:TraM recognition domain-containing protein [Gammaproteobacteria bacterium]
MDDLLTRLASWSDPWFWVCIAAVLYANTVIGFLPLSSERELTPVEHLLMHARRILLLLLLLLFPGFPLCLWFLAANATGDITAANNIVNIVVISQAGRMWGLMAGFLLAGLLSRIVFLRYLYPRFSSWYIFRRVSQRGDQVSDIRTEANRFREKQFRPEKHYRAGRIFIGLREDNTPMYVPVEDWKTWNQRMVGATQTGKGILFGVQLDQSVRRGFCTVFFDIKPDQHALGIMRKACEDTGRRLVTVDFNGELPGKWSPFRTGTDREIKTRLMHAYNLSERGDTADFYKIGEREFLESVFDKWSRELIDLPKLLRDAAKPPPTVTNLTREMLALSALKPGRSKGVDIERVLRENAVLYVRSSATDPVVKRATQVFLLCLLQAATRMYRRRERSSHLFIGLDEVKFLATDILGDMLATITGFDCHLAIAYQSLGDLKSVNKRLVNVEALEFSVENNCKMSLYYQPNDFETADYAARQSGTKQASRYRMNVDINRAGGEVYADRNLITQEDVYYIHPNTLMMLPSRVAMAKMPGRLAEIVHTSWVAVDPIYLDHPRHSRESGNPVS